MKYALVPVSRFGITIVSRVIVTVSTPLAANVP